MFAVFFIPDFPLQALVRAEATLRERALAVLEGTPPQERVLAVNDAACALGIESGLLRTHIEQIPEVVLRPRSPQQERAAQAALLDCACAFSPRVEDAAPGLVLLDASGLERIFGPAQELAREMAQRAAQVGFEAHVAVAANLDAAILAAQGFSGITVIAPGHEAERLGGLPVDVLFRRVEQHAREAQEKSTAATLLQTLDRWGIRTLRALAALPEVPLSERLGTPGLLLRRLACGQGERRLVPTDQPLQFEEAIELENPLTLLEPLAFVLQGMIESLCARLESRALAALALHLRLEVERIAVTEDGVPVSDAVIQGQEAPVITRSFKLPVPLRDAKVFLKLLQLELQAHPPQAPVKKISLEMEAAPPRHAQQGLFLPAAPPPERLELLLARLAGVVGEGNVGAAVVLDSHRPDAVRMERFTAPTVVAGQKKRPRSVRTSPDTAVAPESLPLTHADVAGHVALAFRRFRPPLKAEVMVHGATPVRIAFGNLRADVCAATGPWQIAGEWWSDEAWMREEWDVAVKQPEGMGLYRLFRGSDGAWFINGRYD